MRVNDDNIFIFCVNYSFNSIVDSGSTLKISFAKSKINCKIKYWLKYSKIAYQRNWISLLLLVSSNTH